MSDATLQTLIVVLGPILSIIVTAWVGMIIKRGQNKNAEQVELVHKTINSNAEKLVTAGVAVINAKDTDLASIRARNLALETENARLLEKATGGAHAAPLILPTSQEPVEVRVQQPVTVKVEDEKNLDK